MNGAESLVHTAVASGLEVCFANPGTTEMPLVGALDSVPGMRAVLGVFEGVCTGAADGYGRMAGRPAMTLLHLGPGFANGIANLHNARRARSPVVNVIGEQSTWHRPHDAPLTTDIQALGGPVSALVRTNAAANTLAADMADTIGAAMAPPGQVATLIVPHDCQWEPADGPASPPHVGGAPAAAPDAIALAERQLRQDQPTALFLGGSALTGAGLRQAARVAAVTGCRLICETFPARMERGAGLPGVERFPYFPEQGIAALASVRGVVLAGAKSPVAFFGYKDTPSRLVSDAHEEVVLATPDEDVVGALDALANGLGAGPAAGEATPAHRPERPTGDLDPDTVAAAIAAVQPEGAIVMEEGATTGLHYYDYAAGAPPYAYLTLTGGALGQGPPCAVGAAIACPDRPVINLQADGSALFTLQALWTQAQQGLNVTTLLCNNRSYRVLQFELMRAGVTDPGPQAQALTNLTGPVLDWVHLATGFGVPAVRVDTADALVRELERSLAEPGPRFVEMML